MLHGVKLSGACRSGGRRWIAQIVAVILLLWVAFSCALPARHQDTADTGKAGAAAVEEPKPGDVKIMGGVEYIYGKNVRWPTLPGEPEYKWIRKDQFAARPFDSLRDALSDRAEDKKEIEELQKRLDRLERQMKGLDDAPTAP